MNFFFFFLLQSVLVFFKFCLFGYSLLVVLGLCCYSGFSVVAMNRAYSSCDEQASHCFFFCRAQNVGCMGFPSVAPRLWSTGSIVVVHGLSCSAACGILLDQGWNLCLLHWEMGSLLLSHQGSPGL